MNIDAIKDRLVIYEAGRTGDYPVAGITGVSRAYAQAPQTMPDGDLPLFCNYVGPTTGFVPNGSGLWIESRIFRCVLYVAPILQGLDGEAEAKAEPFIPLGQQAFLSHPSMGTGYMDETLDGVQNFEYVGDSGVGVFIFNKQLYIGVEFRVQVTAVVSSTPDKFE